MKRTLLAAAGLAGWFALSSCESTPNSGTNAGASVATTTDAGALESGRALFEGRCARCHALPKIAAHSAAEWPGVIAQMAKRSGLKPDQSRSVLSYVLQEKKKG